MEPFITIADQEPQPSEQRLLSLQVQTEMEEAAYGKFSMGPLERGFGMTLGNPLRRVLLSSIPGAAVTWVRFEGVAHEYSALPHVKEEVLELLQLVKAIRIRPLSERPGRLRLEVTGPGDVYAGDIVTPPEFQVMNPELHLATLDSSEGRLVAEFNVEHGKGYMPASHANGLPIGTLPVDAVFSPVRKVNYTVEHMRVGQVTDYERLVLEVWTDGTISPQKAVEKAAQILLDHVTPFAKIGKPAQEALPLSPTGMVIPPEVYQTPVEKLELSSRTLNTLKRAGVHKVGQILEKTQEDLRKIRNFGDKSLEELINRLRDKELPIPPGPQEQEAVPAGEAVGSSAPREG